MLPDYNEQQCNVRPTPAEAGYGLRRQATLHSINDAALQS